MSRRQHHRSIPSKGELSTEVMGSQNTAPAPHRAGCVGAITTSTSDGHRAPCTTTPKTWGSVQNKITLPGGPTTNPRAWGAPPARPETPRPPVRSLKGAKGSKISDQATKEAVHETERAVNRGR